MISFHRSMFLPSCRVLGFRLKSDLIESIENNSAIDTVVDKDLEAKEAEIEKSRNKSRLQPGHYNIMHDRKPYDNAYLWFHNTVKYQRRMWANYVAASGVDPSICWPSKQEIKKIKEYESIAYPFTIDAMIADSKQKREEQITKMYERDAKVAAKVVQIEKWKTDLKAKVEKRLNDAKAAKAKKERLVEEVRRHFGFKVSPHDERFQEMIEKKEKEQKKKEKEAKRAAREAQLIAKLQQKNLEVLQETKDNK